MIRFELVSTRVLAAVGSINESIVRVAAGPSFSVLSRNEIHFSSSHYAQVLAASRASVVRVDPLSPFLHAVVAKASSAVTPANAFDEERLPVVLREKMMPHQREGIQRAIECNSLLLADDMGMGKTLQGLGVIAHSGKPAVVITKPKPAFQWATEAAKWASHLRVVVITKGDQHVDYGNTDIVVVSYNLVGKPTTPKFNEIFVQNAERWGWIIADECHALKHPSSQRTKALLPVLSRAKQHVLLITAKPMGSRPAEAWTLLKIMFQRDMLDWVPYAMRYCAGVSRYGRLDARGISNAEELAIVLESCMLRRYQDSLAQDLPSMHLELQMFKLPSSALKECRALTAQFEHASKEHEEAKTRATAVAATSPANEYAIERANHTVDVTAQRMKQLRSAAYVAVGVAKAPYVAKACAELAATNFASPRKEKTIVFTHHVAVRKAIVLACRAIPGLDVGEIGGETSPAERKRVVDGLRSKDSPLNVGVLAFGACAEGMDVTPEVTLVIEAELPWNDDVAAQALRRIHRIGQNKPVRGILMVARNTVDEVVLRSLRTKRRRAVTVVGAAEEDTKWTFDTQTAVEFSSDDEDENVKRLRTSPQCT